MDVVARKHRAVSTTADDMLIPAELILRCLDPAESSAAHKERSQWFRDRQIDPGDWSQVHPILVASSRFHGIPYAAIDRVWIRSVGIDEWRRINQGKR